MPTINTLSSAQGREERYDVLVTGFGPFLQYKENPSWLAVKPLHNTVLLLDEESAPIQVHGRVVMEDASRHRRVQITALEVPVVYDAVLDTVPGLYQQPPVHPATDSTHITPQAPREGYDLIIHVGVAGTGPLRAEKLGHKSGYRIPDAEGKLGAFERHYDEFDEELETEIDLSTLKLAVSTDAGHYLCDFIYYCSLAESRRAGRGTPVLFVHCPPNLDHVPITTEALQDIIVTVISSKNK